MGLFDRLKNQPAENASAPAEKGGNKSKRIVFERLPENLEEFKMLPQAGLVDPFDTAALTVLAFCFYPDRLFVAAHIPV